MQISLDTSKSDGTIGLPGGSDSKESACNTGDPDPIPGWRRSAGERNGNPVLPVFLSRNSCGQRRSLVGYNPWGHKESDMTEQLTTQCIYKISLATVVRN